MDVPWKPTDSTRACSASAAAYVEVWPNTKAASDGFVTRSMHARLDDGQLAAGCGNPREHERGASTIAAW